MPKPDGSKETLYLFKNDDDRIGEHFQDFECFVRVRCADNTTTLSNAQFTFQEQSALAFQTAMDHMNEKYKCDFNDVPNLSEFFSMGDEDDGDGGENDTEAHATGNQARGAGQFSTVTPKILKSSRRRPSSGLCSGGGALGTLSSNTVLRSGPSFEMQGGVEVAEASPGAHIASCRSAVSELGGGSEIGDGETVWNDDEPLPSTVSGLCDYWKRRMDLRDIHLGKRLGHAMRQARDLCSKHASDPAVTTELGLLRRHMQLAEMAREVAPGAKVIGKLSDADLLAKATQLLSAGVQRGIHVHEQFL